MAQLQDGSECAEGIFVNTTNNYTMVKLPAGAAGDVGLNKNGQLFYDTITREISFYDNTTTLYYIPKVDFTTL
jgi:hypothetical protein